MPINTIEKFIQGYIKKDTNEIEEFIKLFSDQANVEMIGIGATTPGNYEWFIGLEQIKDIILSDWQNWGNVVFDKDTLVITEKDNTAWFRICAKLEQIDSSPETWDFFLSQMKDLLDKEGVKAEDKMFNATHYGIRRLYERNLGKGHMWSMVVTGVLVKEDIWKFHTLHWSMPVE